MCVCVIVSVCVFALLSFCVCVCVRMCVSASLYLCVSVCARVCVCVCDIYPASHLAGFDTRSSYSGVRLRICMSF